MCCDLEAVGQSVCDYAQAFDAGSLIPAEAGRVVSLCAAIEGSVATLKALAAARLADGGSWRSEGYRSAEEQLADRTGVGTGQARRQLQNGRRLAEHPEVAQAALSGELSAEQAELVAVGAEADASKAGDLIDKAKRGSIGELRDEVTQVRADHIDREEQRRRIHASRRLLKFVDLEGVWRLMASGNVEDGMTVDSLLTPIRQRLNRLRRDRGQDLQTFGQLDYDALMALAEIACGREGEISLADLVDLGFFAQLRDLGGATLAVPPTATEDGSGSGYGRALGVGAGAAAGTGASVALAPPIPPRPGPSASGSGDSTALSRQLPSGVPSGPGSRFDELGSPPAAQPGATEPVGLSPVGLSPVGRGEASRPAVAGPEPPPKRRPPRLAGRPINLMIRVDLDTLLRGVPIQGELCEIPGYGPIPVSLIQDLAANGSVFVSAVLANPARSSASTATAAAPTSTDRPPWTSSTRDAPSKAATAKPDSNTNTASTGNTPTTPSTTSWTGSAGSTTSRRPTTAGCSSKAPANEPLSPPTTPATPDTTATKWTAATT